MNNLAIRQNPVQAFLVQQATPMAQKKINEMLLAGKASNEAKQNFRNLQILGARAVKLNSFPHINPKYEGLKYGGWMEISMANRPPQWRLKRMKFYGEWCSEKSLDDILPDVKNETRDRAYAITPRMFDKAGDEYDVSTYYCINPENMDDLELQVRQYCKHVAEQSGFDFDLDECFFEVRA